MDEATLRELAGQLRSELATVLPDEDERGRVATELDEALALPAGTAKAALQAVIGQRPATRDWAATRSGRGVDPERIAPQLPGQTPGVGLHYICPKGDIDRYTESAADDPGRCSVHGLRLVRAND